MVCVCVCVVCMNESFQLSTNRSLEHFPELLVFREIHSVVGFPGGSVVKNLPANEGDTGLIPGAGRSPGVGSSNLLQLFLPGKFHGQRSLAGYSPRGGRVEHDLVTKPPPMFCGKVLSHTKIANLH